MDEFRDPSTLFDRAASMPRPARKHPHGQDHRLRIEQRVAEVSMHPHLPHH
ncbi:hypothetical protein ACR9E3_02965 [Actinomycetospora sp. C-140]